MSIRAPKRPRRCGICTMFGHDRRHCEQEIAEHSRSARNRRRVQPYSISYHPQRPAIGFHGLLSDHCTIERSLDMALMQYRTHVGINQRWVDRGGAGHTVPEPHIPKTPYELACENDCKITETAECCICMEDLTEKNKVTTACGHQFHFGCVSHPTIVNCPMCRAIIKP